ncbi:hypothetical protein [Amycolatopsis kentuckyensis]|uniref:hypothetical protein n=1 Tax=Amycolatopsis kentuckyensis TaxID=218823 RepID=UPI0035690BF2
MTQPPGTGSLLDQLNDLRRQVAELSRRGPAFPTCRVVLNAAIGIGAGDSFAPGSWNVREDQFGWFTSAAPSYITVGLAGYYMLSYHSTTTGLASGAVAASKVTLNAANVANALASDLVISSGTSEGCVQTAFRARVFMNAGDKLYWSNYCSAAGGTLQATSFAIPTEMTVQFISSR